VDHWIKAIKHHGRLISDPQIHQTYQGEESKLVDHFLSSGSSTVLNFGLEIHQIFVELLLLRVLSLDRNGMKQTDAFLGVHNQHKNWGDYVIYALTNYQP